jgi:hypothetical protein
MRRVPFMLGLCADQRSLRYKDELTCADSIPWTVAKEVVFVGADGPTKFTKAQGETTDDE